MEYDDKITSEQLAATSTASENKSVDFDDFSSPNSSIKVACLSRPEFYIELKKNSDVNLFNDTYISTSTDTNKDTWLAPMDFFQVVARGCVHFYTGLEGADVFETTVEYVKVCEGQGIYSLAVIKSTSSWWRLILKVETLMQ